ncbi:MAG TPA: aldo/keto reductase [Abditibacteriaceae bacterium]|jgi:hypothetical protein
MTNENVMKYRRFGRTELQMPVFSCGGMRYQQAWKDVEPEEVEKAGQANLEATIERALELGINHIETARGYGSSEMQLGWILPKLPREKLIVQTKVWPNEDPKVFLENFEKSMSYLKLDYVDLMSFHGVNDQETLNQTVLRGGCMEAARRLQKDGRVRFIGFSTHGTQTMITRAVNTSEFDYFNVHWYFVNPLNWPSIEAAQKQDMGVFIISPNDKGGKLYEPSPKIKELCAPLSPMQFNDLYCLSRPQVHTLSCGAARPSDFDEHIEALQHYDRAAEVVAPIEKRLREEMNEVLGEDWCSQWSEGIPDHHQIPGDLNVMEILRLWTFARSLDLVEWGKMRYNLMGGAGHWFPGCKPGEWDKTQEPQLLEVLKNSPFAARIPSILEEAHELMAAEEKKRLSQS